MVQMVLNSMVKIMVIIVEFRQCRRRHQWRWPCRSNDRSLWLSRWSLKVAAMWCLVVQESAAVETLHLSSLNGTNGFKLDGEYNDDYSGVSVSAAGDINGDGYAI